jgi:hypothetical protein
MSIIAAKKIDVPDPPKVQSTDIVLQILENVSAQVALIDVELFSLLHSENCSYSEVSACVCQSLCMRTNILISSVCCGCRSQHYMRPSTTSR